MPFRVFSKFIHESAIVIILLRLINVAFVAAGLAVLAKFFRLIHVKRRYVSLGFLFFIALPVVPLVSAQINYDNLLFLCIAVFILLGTVITRAPKPDLVHLLLLIALGCFASLIKFTFLPVFFVAGLYLLSFSHIPI